MQRLEFEPFGEQVAVEDKVRPAGVSSRLTRLGLGVFWSLVVIIVVARAAYFEPAVFDAFARVTAFAQNLSGFF